MTEHEQTEAISENQINQDTSPMIEPVVSPQPIQIAPIQQANPSESPKPATNPLTIVLQWLTYAFWGWTVLATSILVYVVMDSFISNDAAGSGFTPYGIAAVLVLLPISIASDVFYAKHEQPKKSGVSSAVMVIHAVIFALFAIGALISVVFSIVSMMTSSNDNSGAAVAAVSGTIIFVLYVATFLRTINPWKQKWMNRSYIMFMTAVVGIIAILGVVGPVANAHKTKDDRLIEAQLYSLTSSINDYTKSQDKLPDSLSSLTLNGDAAKLTASNLVEYKPNTKPSTKPSSTYYSSSYDTARTIYYYQLCVTYKGASNNSYSGSYRSNEYQSYISTTPHAKGSVCYNVKTSDY